MSLQEQAEQLIEECGPLLDVEQIALFREDQVWMVTVGDGRHIEIAFADEPARFVLQSVLGAIHEQRRPKVHELMLRTAYLWRDTGGARMALDAEGDAVLQLDLPFTGLDLALLVRVITNIARTSERWRELIEAAPEPSAEAADDLAENERLAMTMRAFRV